MSEWMERAFTGVIGKAPGWGIVQAGEGFAAHFLPVPMGTAEAWAGNPHFPVPDAAADDRGRIRGLDGVRQSEAEEGGEQVSVLETIRPAYSPHVCPLETFIACATVMVDSATPEPVLCKMEPRLLAQLPALHALGVFELFEIRHPALRAWLHDELKALEETMTPGYLDAMPALAAGMPI
jgi:hypothetical protein